MSWNIRQGDCLDVLRAMRSESVDSIVTDPPYGLEFMGKEWDKLTVYAGIREGNGKHPKARSSSVSYVGSPNPTCRNCGGLRSLVTEGSGGRTKCRCETPDFPDYRTPAMQAMQAWHLEWCREALRVLKPGGHLLAFGGTRTYHRLACAIEDAGFEVRDSLDWIYGQGFPKSLDVSKAIDAMMGAERTPTGEVRTRHGGGAHSDKISQLDPEARETPITKGATAEAVRFEGWGTALKPAHEPIVLARKPLGSTVAANVLAHGTGALNVDGCRVATGDDLNGGAYAESGGRSTLPGDARDGAALGMLAPGKTAGRDFVQPAGRWPPNLLLTHAPGCRRVGDRKVKTGIAVGGSHATSIFGAFMSRPADADDRGYASEDGTETIAAYECVDGCPVKMMDGQSEGTARFFPTFTWEESDFDFLYCAKASKRERNAGCDDLEKGNAHPTVKPVALMRWLVRLITPPNGIVIDPFLGSGTTGVAAVREGFHFFGIEREESYIEIARRRITAALQEG